MSACVEHQGQRQNKGYGRVYLDGRSRLAHRVAWEAIHGPIPAGMVIMHTCDNPPCVNVEHLRLGTQRDNMADKVTKGRQAKGAMCRRSGLTDAAVEVIREVYPTGLISRSDLAQRFGVTPGTISHIAHGRTWKHLPVVA